MQPVAEQNRQWQKKCFYQTFANNGVTYRAFHRIEICITAGKKKKICLTNLVSLELYQRVPEWSLERRYIVCLQTISGTSRIFLDSQVAAALYITPDFSSLESFSSTILISLFHWLRGQFLWASRRIILYFLKTLSRRFHARQWLLGYGKEAIFIFLVTNFSNILVDSNTEDSTWSACLEGQISHRNRLQSCLAQVFSSCSYADSH